MPGTLWILCAVPRITEDNFLRTPDFHIPSGKESGLLEADQGASMTKKLSPLEKKSRKPTSRACVFCHSKHLQCSQERPCKNCVKRNIAEQCEDVVRKRAKYMVTGRRMSRDGDLERASSRSRERSQVVTPESRSESVNTPPTQEPQIKGDVVRHLNNANWDRIHMLDTTSDVMDKLLFNGPLKREDSEQEPVNRSVSSDKYISEVFNSNILNQEYLILGDIILHSKPSSPSPSNTSASEYNLTSTVSPSSTMIHNNKDRHVRRLPNHSISESEVSKDSRPFISLGFPEAEILQSHETDAPEGGKPSEKIEYISPLISHHLYRSVQDIYSDKISSYDYPESYHSLTKFLKSRFSGNSLPEEQKQAKRNNLLVVLKLIASYRPTFIAAHKNLLKPFDLQFLEMSFQRSLLDYEKLSRFNSSPTIMWRRTGEVVYISDDILSLLGYGMSDILSKRTFIMELMYDDESIINYFKLFKSVAVGNLHSSIITKLKLFKNVQNGTRSSISTPETLSMQQNSNQYIEFCSVWTVKRDIFDLPMLVIGQFLPVLPPGEGVRMY